METVAPHAGAWIETLYGSRYTEFLKVAPHAGAWIETALRAASIAMSHVAPHAGAWIETQVTINTQATDAPGRTPRGCVD